MTSGLDAKVARRLIERWRGDPVAFAREALGLDRIFLDPETGEKHPQLWAKECEVLEAVRDHERARTRSLPEPGSSTISEHRAGTPPSTSAAPAVLSSRWPRAARSVPRRAATAPPLARG